MLRRLLVVLVALPSVIAGTAASAVAQFSVTPDTVTQIRESGESLRVVQWVVATTPREQQIFAHNRTDRPMLVQSYSVTECAGILIKQCRDHRVSVLLPPHTTRPIGHISARRDIQGGYRYRLIVTAVAVEDNSRISLSQATVS